MSSWTKFGHFGPRGPGQDGQNGNFGWWTSNLCSDIDKGFVDTRSGKISEKVTEFQEHLHEVLRFKSGHGTMAWQILVTRFIDSEWIGQGKEYGISKILSQKNNQLILKLPEANIEAITSI